MRRELGGGLVTPAYAAPSSHLGDAASCLVKAAVLKLHPSRSVSPVAGDLPRMRVPARPVIHPGKRPACALHPRPASAKVSECSLTNHGFCTGRPAGPAY